MASYSSISSHNVCMICLDNLWGHENNDSRLKHNGNGNGNDKDDDFQDDDLQDDDSDNHEIGAVFPCGHVFHLKCWQQWDESRCPSCNQDANLFSKLYIGAPPLPPSPPETVPVEVKVPVLRSLEDVDNEEERHILLDMRTAQQEGAAETIRKVVSLSSRLRKQERKAASTESELDSTKLVLKISQEELELANKEVDANKTKVDHYRGKLARIQAHHWQRHRILHEELVGQHKRELINLQKQLEQAKGDLALRNRQLAHWTGVRVGSAELGPEF